MPNLNQLKENFSGAAFQTAMQDLRVAKDFITHHLGEKEQELIHLESLSIFPGHFVDPQHEQTASDITYQVLMKADNSPAFVYVLLENPEVPDELLPLRVSKAHLAILSTYRTQHPDAKKIPPVFKLVLYMGPSPYPYSIQ